VEKEPEQQASDAGIEQRLESDTSISRKLAERYLGDRRNRNSNPAPDSPRRRQSDNEEQNPAIEA
jgi:hypothetical protein